MIGDRLLAGLGMKTSSGHTITETLQPLQKLGSKIIGRPGVGRLGVA
jgi:hypothetical protein